MSTGHTLNFWSKCSLTASFLSNDFKDLSRTNVLELREEGVGDIKPHPTLLAQLPLKG